MNECVSICINVLSGVCFLFKQCRQARISYTGKLLADIYFQRGDKAPVREQFNFGQFPIMLMVNILFLYLSILVFY